MILTHEMGQEMGPEEVIRKAKRLVRYLRDKEKIAEADLDYALHYWQEVLENKFHG